MENSKQKQHHTFPENDSSFKIRSVKIVDKIYNSTWGLGAFLAAISAWTAGVLYV